MSVKPCRKCGASEFEAHDEGGRVCTLCVRYDTLVANSRKVRANVATPELDLTREQFHAWAAARELVCEYCRIPEHLVRHLGVLTQVGHNLRRLGIDRADNDGGYAADNLRWCCFACNKAKSNTFSEAEMRIVGESIAAVWQDRLAKAGL
jgi:hypothetical protein